MVDLKIIDPKDLELKARRAEERETGEVIYETENLRVIVGARVPAEGISSLFIELTTYPCQRRQDTDVDFLKSQYLLVKELQALGFSSFQDGAAIIAELLTTSNNYATDLDRIRCAISGIFG